jgi:hypothetical protein
MANRRHQRTPESVTEVTAYATVGVPHHDIALLVHLSTKTLLKHYRKELDIGKARGNATISKRVFAMAAKGHLGACCFWLKTQAGWRETSVVQNQALDRNGTPVDPPGLNISFEDGGPGRALDNEPVRPDPAAPEGPIH